MPKIDAHGCQQDIEITSEKVFPLKDWPVEIGFIPL
jgi:hypothetical protein